MSAAAIAGGIVALVYMQPSPATAPAPSLAAVLQALSAVQAAVFATLPPTPSLSAASSPKAAPTQAIPCLPASEHTTLRSFDEDRLLGVCDSSECLLTDGTLAGLPTVADAEILPLAADIRLGDKPAACFADHCKPLGRKLAAAVATEAAQDAPILEATLDLSTAAVGRQMWSIAQDRPIAPARPFYHPNEEVVSVHAAGDLVLVRWGGPCVDSRCETAHLLDARGVERGAAYADGGVLRLSDHTFATISMFSRISIYDLHTGKHIADHAPAGMNGSFVAVARLSAGPVDEGRFALLHHINNGLLLQVVSLLNDRLSVDSQYYYPTCE